MRLVSAALISACAMALCPEGKIKKTVRTICGIATILALVSPISNNLLTDVETTFSNLRDEAITASAELRDLNEEIKDSIIISELSSYISDKGKELGLSSVTADIILKDYEDGTKIPYSVTLSADGAEENILKLIELLSGELGIPKERIYRKGE